MAKLFPTANLEKTTTAWRKKGKLDEVEKLLEKKKNNFDKISFY